MRRSICFGIVALILIAGQMFAAQWDGNDNTTDPISRTGSVGIGTTAISTIPLYIYKGSSGLTGYTNSVLTLENSSTCAMQFLSSSGSPHYILFGNATLSRNMDGWIRYYANSTPYMDFKVNNTVQMTIKSDGKVGIGTASPAEKLDVSGNANISGNAYVGGNVGIGTTTPTQKLDVNGNVTMQNTSGTNTLSINGSGDGTGAAELRLIDATDSKYWMIQRRDNAFSASNNLHFSFYDGSSWTPTLDLTPNGNVGIGVSSPTAKLEVAGTIKGDYVEIDAQDGTNEGGELKFNGAGSYLPWYADVYTNRFRLITDGAERFTVNSTGNVGIGTSAPSEKLSVSGNIMITDANNDIVKIGELGGGAGRFDFGFQGGASATQNMIFYGGDESNSWKMDNFTVQSSVISLAGNVGIGTSNPGTYALAVNGSIRAKEVIVETGWSDFVFDGSYKLRSLDEVEKYIKANKHLPDVPSEAEVKANGVSIGDMQSKLLQKIEELTLYVIELKKENQDLQKRVKSLETK